MTLRTFVKAHPVAMYFALTFAISWTLVLLVVGEPAAIPTPNEQALRLLGVAILVMVAGPFVMARSTGGLPMWSHGRVE